MATSNTAWIVNRGLIAGNSNGITISTSNFFLLSNSGLITSDKGAGISVEIGDVDGDIVYGHIFNSGRIQSDGIGGIYLFSGVGFEETVTFRGGHIVNKGEIIGGESGIRVDPGVTFDGHINNWGTIEGQFYGIVISGTVNGDINNWGTIEGNTRYGNAIYASSADAAVTVNNFGTLNGDVVLSNFDDVFNSSEGQVNGAINGGGGNDIITGGPGNDIINGGPGNDIITGGMGDHILTGGPGNDGFVFAPSDGFPFGGSVVISDYDGREDYLDLRPFDFTLEELNDIVRNARLVEDFSVDYTVLSLDQNWAIALPIGPIAVMLPSGY